MILPGKGAKRDHPAFCSLLNVGTFRKLLKTAEKKGSVLKAWSGTVPLPGVLDHREFTRVRTDLGQCDGCAEGKAVHRSGDGRLKLCEACYARVVQAWNAGRGLP